VRAGDRFGFCTAVTPEFGPDPAEGEQRSVVVSANQMTSFLFVSGFGSGAYSAKLLKFIGPMSVKNHTL
jgi:hypothetical protein